MTPYLASSRQSRTHGTIFDTITYQTFKVVETVLVPLNLAHAFQSVVNSLVGCILSSLQESRTLAAQPDALESREVGVGT